MRGRARLLWRAALAVEVAISILRTECSGGVVGESHEGEGYERNGGVVVEWDGLVMAERVAEVVRGHIGSKEGYTGGVVHGEGEGSDEEEDVGVGQLAGGVTEVEVGKAVEEMFRCLRSLQEEVTKIEGEVMGGISSSDMGVGQKGSAKRAKKDRQASMLPVVKVPTLVEGVLAKVGDTVRRAERLWRRHR